mgnify:CR=1 FL=1
MTMIKSALLAGGALLAATTALQAQEKLLIGSTSASSSHYGYFIAVGKIVNEDVDGIEASVVETGASMDNMRRIMRDQIDLGLVTTNVARHAYDGTNAFDGEPVDIRLLWVYTAAPQNVVVRADAGIETLADLEGQRFNPGIKGSATELTAEAVLGALGIAPDYVRGSTTDVVNMVKDNRIVGYVKSGAGQKLDASTLDIATFTPISILSLDDAQQQTLSDTMKDVTVVAIPEGAGDGLPAYSAWSFGAAVVAPADMDDDTAYAIVSAIMADQPAQANAMASLAGSDLAETTVTYGTVPLHDGAARWFSEQGIELPEAIAPVSN